MMREGSTDGVFILAAIETAGFEEKLNEEDERR